VLINHLAGAHCPPRLLRQIGLAIVISASVIPSARAGGIGDLSCLGMAKSFSCAGRWDMAPGDPYVRPVPEPSEAQKAALRERDRKWLAHCRPVVERDPFGVARYRYAVPGCEFGIGAD
jgi:hypothetical protein